MAKKKVEGAFGDLLKKLLDDAGKIDFAKLAALIVEIIAIVPKSPDPSTPPVMQTSGCCDHEKCSADLVSLNMAALMAALNYHCACCDEASPTPEA